MKRLVAAIILLVFIILSAFLCNRLTVNTLEDIYNAFISCTVKEKNEDLDTAKIENALYVWQKKQKILYILMSHDDFDGVEDYVIKLQNSVENPDFEISSQVSFVIAEKIKQINQEASLGMDIIF